MPSCIAKDFDRRLRENETVAHSAPYAPYVLHDHKGNIDFLATVNMIFSPVDSGFSSCRDGKHSSPWFLRANKNRHTENTCDPFVA
jgi:hypothetical protein